MAISFRLNVTGAVEARRYFERLGTTIPRRTIPDALVEIGLKVQRNAAQDQIIRGGAKDAPPDPVQLTSRTGTLRRSIRVNRSGLPTHVDVGTDLVYGRIHELGGGHIPKRPYLKPALEEIDRKGIPKKVMNKHLRRAIEGLPA